MRTLVAGIGNIFMGDDAFGCELAQRLAGSDLPEGVDVVDFGIRGMDLGYALLDGDYRLAVLADTVERGGEPGTIYVIEPEITADTNETTGSAQPTINPHGMNPARVLELVASLGERRPRVLLVACEPAELGGEEGHMGLSVPVAAAVDEGVAEIRRILERWPSSGDATAMVVRRENHRQQKRTASGE